MITSSVVAKNAPVVAPIALTAILPLQTWIDIGAVCAGLAFGAMWRAANLRNEGKAWRAVRSDIAISIMIGGANAVLALALVEWLEVGRIIAMTIGVLVGATGLRAVPEAKSVLVNAMRRKLIGDDVLVVQPKTPAEIKDAVDKLKDVE